MRLILINDQFKDVFGVNEIIPMTELVIIKRDFDLLRKIVTQLKPETQFQLVPYTALFCNEALEYMSKKGYKVEIEQTSKYSIKDIRQKAKFFDLSINKLLESIANIDKLQNDHFIKIMKYPEFVKWNIHDNLGIFFDDQKNIVSNSHYAFYLFQDENNISEFDEIASQQVLNDEELFAFAFDLGTIVGAISSGFSSVSDFIVADVNVDDIFLFHQDFNTNRCSLKNEEYKNIRLFLFHVLSSIGFDLYYLRKVIIRESGLLLRIEYITYHYALKRLNLISNYCNRHKETINDVKLIEMLNSIDNMHEDSLIKSNFRNCMMHYGLIDPKEQFLIDKDKLDLALPFCGLIESQFNMTYEVFKGKLETQLATLYEKIKDYLDIDLLLSIDKE